MGGLENLSYNHDNLWPAPATSMTAAQADGALAIPLTAEDCRAFLRMLATRPGGRVSTEVKTTDQGLQSDVPYVGVNPA